MAVLSFRSTCQQRNRALGNDQRLLMYRFSKSKTRSCEPTVAGGKLDIETSPCSVLDRVHEPRVLKDKLFQSNRQPDRPVSTSVVSSKEYKVEDSFKCGNSNNQPDRPVSTSVVNPKQPDRPVSTSVVNPKQRTSCSISVCKNTTRPPEKRPVSSSAISSKDRGSGGGFECRNSIKSPERPVSSCTVASKDRRTGGGFECRSSTKPRKRPTSSRVLVSRQSFGTRGDIFECKYVKTKPERPVSVSVDLSEQRECEDIVPSTIPSDQFERSTRSGFLGTNECQRGRIIRFRNTSLTPTPDLEMSNSVPGRSMTSLGIRMDHTAFARLDMVSSIQSVMFI